MDTHILGTSLRQACFSTYVACYKHGLCQGILVQPYILPKEDNTAVMGREWKEKDRERINASYSGGHIQDGGLIFQGTLHTVFTSLAGLLGNSKTKTPQNLHITS